ncbi:MAG TPA: TfoX/Sxy family protein, partial [Blastocatellia bacterium]|nr:TfoX/Sxy family protein [Blastocatellia bacterium]
VERVRRAVCGYEPLMYTCGESVMPVSDEYIEFILDQLRGVGEVLPKRMFGGVGLYRDILFFGLIAGDVLYLKVDEVTRPEYERAGSKPFQPYGDAYSMNYYAVPAHVLEDAEMLCRWASQAIEVARRKPPPRKRVSKSKKKR